MTDSPAPADASLPPDVENLFQQAVDFQDRGETDKAIAAYRDVLAAAPEFVPARNNLGMTYIDAGDFDAAVDSFQKAIAIRSDYAEAYNNLGFALRKLGRDREAADYYTQFLALEKDAEDAAKIQSWVDQVRAKSAPPASEPPETATRRPPSTTELPTLAMDLSRASDADSDKPEPPSRSTEGLDLAVLPVEDDADSLATQAQTRLEADDLTGAADLFRRALVANPYLAIAHSGLGNVLTRLGKHDEALVHLREAARIDPKEPVTFFTLGYALRALHRDTEAADAFDRFLTLMPGAEDAEKIRAWVATVRSRAPAPPPVPVDSSAAPAPAVPPAGGSTEASAVELSEDDMVKTPADECASRATALFHDGDFDGALAACEEGIQHDESHFLCHLLLGRVLIRKEDFLRAVPVLRHATELQPGNAEAWFHLGQAYEKRGLMDEARAAYEKCLAASPEGPQAQRVREWLAAQRGTGETNLVRCEYCFKMCPPSMLGQYQGKAICAACGPIYGVTVVVGDAAASPGGAGAAALARRLESKPGRTSTSRMHRVQRHRVFSVAIQWLLLVALLCAVALLVLKFASPDKYERVMSLVRGKSSVPTSGPTTGPVDEPLALVPETPPPTRALLLAPYKIKFKVTGTRSGNGVFSVVGPPGMEINRETGEIVWVPGALKEKPIDPADPKQARVTFEVKAEAGGEKLATPKYSVDVVFGIEAQPPVATGLAEFPEGGVWCAGDVTGDGRPDVIVAYGRFERPELRILAQKPDGGFASPQVVSLPGAVSAMATADFNGDGLSDLAVLDWDRAKLCVFYTAPGGAWSGRSVDLDTGKGPIRMLVDDLNGDGLTDVAVICALNERVEIFLQQKGRGLTRGSALSLEGFDPWALPFVADLGGTDDSRRPAFVVLTRGFPDVDFKYSMLERDGRFGTVRKQVRRMEERPWAIAPGLFGRGGRRMVAMLTGGDTQDVQVNVWGGSEGGLEEIPGWTLRRDDFNREKAYALAAGDLNGDGRSDLAVGFTSGLRVFLSTGEGFRAMPPTGSPDLAALALLACDLDGDRISELIAPRQDGSFVVFRIRR